MKETLAKLSDQSKLDVFYEAKNYASHGALEMRKFN